ncbi:hypothetical protein F4824DRAFT_510227 [Ustulina deusta]|nr:hypothetical protein F4824DRAFT_510227 [Ustulina deusta]
MAMLVLSWYGGTPIFTPNRIPHFAEDREELMAQLNNIDDTTRSYGQTFISGKAGAGKSTLTKFLAGDKRLEEYLQQWARPSDLLLATYYSWNAKNKLQKSHKGFLRAVLHQCLKQFPLLLVPKVFPNRWVAVQPFSPDTPVALPDWRPWELLSGFHALLSLADQGPLDGEFSFNVALIIDGLDEFDDEEDHMSLVELLQ